MSQRLLLLLTSLAIVIAVTIFGFTQLRRQSTTNTTSLNNTNPITNVDVVATNSETTALTNATETPVANVNTSPIVVTQAVVPIEGFYDRITKKPFGIYITPKTSPIQPEKFSGYHTGADAETTSAEKNTDLPVLAMADGTVVFAGHVNGYGGVMVIRHIVNKETVTALYGHLRLASFTKKDNQTVKMGEKIAVLGTGFTSETDNERKHLHLGIIKGTTINYKGYVTTKSALSAWEDPVSWLKENGA